ncbi:KpsF/GutQ family sugar-phosphate isomerase [Candidatus Pelagibacter bacterium]|jgi:arabinose-5-phosphate isomerase|nr:KpsF/GutQ family sugar-phosphate isomerase [Candidatus Pelagibacter bacterium]
MTKKFIPLAKKVIDLEIQALQKLKKKIDNSFNKAVVEITKCKSKVILCGVGKSGLIAAKISATLSSVGTPSFNLSASDSSHGDLGSISKKDILILISYSGKTSELKNIIQYANRNKITLIGIMSKRDSILYKASDIKLVIPEVKESGGIVPTSSTTAQLALGDALAIAAMQYKKFGKFDFKKIHPAGNLGKQLKTVEDIMLTGNKIPFVSQNLNMQKALKILSDKNLGTLIVQNKQKKTIGIITDGQVRRFNQKKLNIKLLTVEKIMTKNPISIDKSALAAKALSVMNSKKITSLCVNDKKDKLKTVGIIHIHNILETDIS